MTGGFGIETLIRVREVESDRFNRSAMSLNLGFD